MKPRVRKWHGFMCDWTGYECSLLDVRGYGSTIESAYREYLEAKRRNEFLLEGRNAPAYILMHVPLEQDRPTLLQRFINLFM